MYELSKDNLTLNLYTAKPCKYKLIPIEANISEWISNCSKASVAVLVKANAIAEEDFEVLLDTMAELDIVATYKAGSSSSTQHRYFSGVITEIRVCGVYAPDARKEQASSYYFKVEIDMESPMAKLRYSLHNRSFDCKDTNVIDKVFKPIFKDYGIGGEIIEAKGQDKSASLGKCFYQRDESDYKFLLQILTSLGWSFIWQSKAPQQSGAEFVPSAPNLVLSNGTSYSAKGTEKIVNFSCTQTLEQLNYMNSWKTASRLAVKRLKATFMDNGTAKEQNVNMGEEYANSPYSCDMNSLPFSMSQYSQESAKAVAQNYLHALHLYHADWTGETMILSGTEAGSPINVLKFYDPEDTSGAALTARVTRSDVTCKVQPNDVLLSGKELPEPDLKVALASIKRSDHLTTPVKQQNILATNSGGTTPSPTPTPVPTTNVKIVEAIVCDANGYTQGLYGKNLPVPESVMIGGTMKNAVNCPLPAGVTKLDSNLPVSMNPDTYTFKAYLNSTATESLPVGIKQPDGTLTPHTGVTAIRAKETIDVRMMMPLGGVGEGLFHVPRLNDRILLICDNNRTYYLAGYLPSKDMKFAGTLALESHLAPGSSAEQIASAVYRNNEITVLRQNDPCGDPAYTDSTTKADSLLNHPKSRRKNAGNDQDKRLLGNNFSEVGIYAPLKNTDGNLVKDGLVNVASQYDLNVSANKEVYVEGRNIEIACPGNRDRWENGKTKNGIVNIHEVADVVIEAEHGIALKCGDTQLSLTPSGIVLTAQKAAETPGPVGAAITMDSFSGVTIAGSRIIGLGTFGISMTSQPGSSMVQNGAGARLEGMTASLGTTDSIATTMNIAILTENFIRQMVAVGKNRDTDASWYKGLNAVLDRIGLKADSVYTSIRHAAERDNNNQLSAGNIAVAVFDLLVIVVNLVLATIKTCQTQEWRHKKNGAGAVTNDEAISIAAMSFFMTQWGIACGTALAARASWDTAELKLNGQCLEEKGFTETKVFTRNLAGNALVNPSNHMLREMGTKIAGKWASGKGGKALVGGAIALAAGAAVTPSIQAGIANDQAKKDEDADKL